MLSETLDTCRTRIWRCWLASGRPIVYVLFDQDLFRNTARKSSDDAAYVLTYNQPRQSSVSRQRARVSWESTAYVTVDQSLFSFFSVKLRTAKVINGIDA